MADTLLFNEAANCDITELVFQSDRSLVLQLAVLYHTLSCNWQHCITHCPAIGSTVSHIVLQLAALYHTLSCNWQQCITHCPEIGGTVSHIVLKLAALYHTLSCNWQYCITRPAIGSTVSHTVLQLAALYHTCLHFVITLQSLAVQLIL